jgi:hypothetical protein
MTLGRPTRAGLIGFRGWRALRHRFRIFFGGQLIVAHRDLDAVGRSG